MTQFTIDGVTYEECEVKEMTGVLVSTGKYFPAHDTGHYIVVQYPDGDSNAVMYDKLPILGITPVRKREPFTLTYSPADGCLASKPDGDWCPAWEMLIEWRTANPTAKIEVTVREVLP